MATSSTTYGSAGPAVGPRSFVARLRNGDEIARLLTFIFAMTVVLITVLLVYQLWVNSALPRHKFGLHFFVTSVWDPIAEQFGALPFIYGTVVTSAVALMIAVPLGIGAAIFLAELAPQRISDTLQFFIDLLAAVPSVIYGLLGIFIVVPLMRTVIYPLINKPLGFLPIFKGPSYGMGFLTAGIVLAIMVIPYIISVSREVLLSVPRDQREAALALGATRWESTWKVVVPFAKTGIMGSIFLALARALGETMAVTMVIGNTPRSELRCLLRETRLHPLLPISSPRPPEKCIRNLSLPSVSSCSCSPSSSMAWLVSSSSSLPKREAGSPDEQRRPRSLEKISQQLHDDHDWSLCLDLCQCSFSNSWLPRLQRRHLHQLGLLHPTP